MTWSHLRRALRAQGLARTDDPDGASDRPVTGIAYDSRVVKPGNVFVALKGQHADGTAFVRQALERGAVAVVSA